MDNNRHKHFFTENAMDNDNRFERPIFDAAAAMRELKGFRPERHIEKGDVRQFAEGLMRCEGEVAPSNIPLLDRAMNEMDVQRDRLADAAEWLERFCNHIEGDVPRNQSSAEYAGTDGLMPPAKDRLQYRISRLDDAVTMVERAIDRLRGINLL